MNLIKAFAEFEKWKLQQERIAHFRSAFSTEELKRLWDAFDGDAGPDEPGYFWPKDGPHIEDVHMLLNERGEGAYCAV